jgi:hypothetical protein
LHLENLLGDPRHLLVQRSQLLAVLRCLARKSPQLPLSLLQGILHLCCKHRGLLEFFALHFDDGGKLVSLRLQHCLALLTLSCVFVFASPSVFSKSSAHQGESYSSRERRHAHLFWRA